ncbi:hypothetical protein [Agromyces sp. NDB4Y10]|uniref:hypothetical protein n=1 Tax=Agromyces sp. NDB4Y10 TaxID=1775951 RepID=UPI0008325AC2|nr:hypothetical protein [Agromyces sp. NDB4Y10]
MPEASPARPSRRMPHPRATAAVLSCALLLGTAACASPDGDAPRASTTAPSAAATDEPIFASDEEALAAAVEAYEAYSEMSTRIASEGGTNPERITEVVSENAASQLVEEFEALAEAQLRTTGTTNVYGARLMSWEQAGEDTTVSAYFCRDVSGVRIINASGADVTKPRTSDVSALVATFVVRPDDPSKLIVEDTEPWSDITFCE